MQAFTDLGAAMEERLHPAYHHETFSEKEKSKGFVKIISPLKGGKEASNEQETRVEPVLEGTIPIHADYLVGASITVWSSIFVWNAGADDVVEAKTDRKVEPYLLQMRSGKAKT